MSSAEEELLFRIEELELAMGLGSGSSGSSGSSGDDCIPDELAELEKRVGQMEGLLNPAEEEEDGIAVGAECTAYSVVEKRWVEARVVGRPKANQYLVEFAPGERRELPAERVRASKIDLVAVERAEDAVREIARAMRLRTGIRAGPTLGNADGAPLGIPLTVAGQRAVVEGAREDLLAGAAQLSAIFKEPQRLEQFIDTQAMRDMPHHAKPLGELEKRHGLSTQRASNLSGEVRQVVEEYAEMINLLNEKNAHWDEVIALAEQRKRKKEASTTAE